MSKIKEEEDVICTIAQEKSMKLAPRRLTVLWGLLNSHETHTHIHQRRSKVGNQQREMLRLGLFNLKSCQAQKPHYIHSISYSAILLHLKVSYYCIIRCQ